MGTPLRGRDLRAIWLSLLASDIGDWSTRIALAILVLERTHSEALSSLVLALAFLPWVGPGQVLATRLSHLPRVRVMVAADLVRAAAYAALLVRVPVALLLVLVLVGGLATPPFEAARSALTVDVVPAEEYGTAVALLEFTDQSAIVVGYLLGGLWVLVGGYRLALLLNVASFLVSAAAIGRIRSNGPPPEPAPVTAQLARGLRVLWRDRVIRRGVGTLLLVALPAVAVEATAAVYARNVLGAGANVAGELAAAVPLGIIATIPFLPRTGSGRHLLRVAAAVAVAGGIGGGLAFGVGGFPGAIIGYLAAGVLSSAGTPAMVAFQPRIPKDDRTAVFSVAQGTLMALQAVGAALGGVLAGVFGARHAAIGWMVFVVVLAGLTCFLPIDADAEFGKGAPPD